MAVLPDPGRSRAVLIGASTYRHLEDLPAVRNNLSGFRDVLVAPALGGLPADNCTVVAEPATPVDVYRALRQQAAAAEDTLLVYFAGHGRTGSRNELWLCLPGTDPDELPYSAWPYDELRRVVADSRAAKKVVILDCCFSGRALADQAGDEETILGQVGIEGTYLLTATAANAVALAPPGERYTAFTGALLGLLTKGIPDGPELLTFAQIYPRLQYTLTSRQLPRPRQQGSDTIAHLALTRNLAYTGRGGTWVFNERFAAITAQLGDAQPAVRLAGVHAMAALADDWPENRQTCVDVLCAYLRLPYDPDPGDDADPAERAAYRANREVRHTIIRVITAHLQADAVVSWQGQNFDFTGVVFDGGDFRSAMFSAGRSASATPCSPAARSASATPCSPAARSASATPSSPAARSTSTAPSSPAARSTSAAPCSPAARSASAAPCSPAAWSASTLPSSPPARSASTLPSSPPARSTSRDAVFSGSLVEFLGAVFSGGQVSFRGAVFSGGQVGFDIAEFSGGQVSFRGAVFSGGQVKFNRARRWSPPPTFSWGSEPPMGVVLPVQLSEEKNGVASVQAAAADSQVVELGRAVADVSPDEQPAALVGRPPPTPPSLTRRWPWLTSPSRTRAVSLTC